MAKYSSEANCKVKQRYATKSEAKAEAQKAWDETQEELRSYQCHICLGFHLTAIHYG